MNEREKKTKPNFYMATLRMIELKFEKFQKFTLIMGLLLAGGLAISIFLHKVTSVY